MAEMNRKEIIKNLEYLISYDCTGTQYDCKDEIQGAIDLLRSQEPRVLTPEEIRSGAVEVAWVEDRDKAEVIPGIWFRLSNEGEDEAVDIHIRDGFVGARLAVYGKLWRCWTAKPSDEQRKAVKWND